MENITRDNGNLAECCTAANGLQSSSSGALVLLDDHSEGQVLGVDLELVLVEGHVNGVALGRGVASSLLTFCLLIVFMFLSYILKALV